MMNYILKFFFQGVLQKFLHDNLKLQIAALYSVQVFCFNLKFPKGMYKWEQPRCGPVMTDTNIYLTPPDESFKGL